MKTTIVMFCYRGEEEILPVSVSRVREVFPKAGIYLFDDSKDPIGKHVVAGLTEDAAVHYEQTTFNRGINLNGGESVKGQLKCMNKALLHQGNTDGWIAKMDPDTLILRPGLIQEAFRKGMDSFMGTSEHGLFAGMFYACRVGLFNKVYKLSPFLDIADDAPEDLTIGSLIYMHTGKMKCAWINAFRQEERKFMAAFEVRKIGSPEYPREIDFVARNGHIITVGNTTINNMPKGLQVQAAHDLVRAVRALESQAKFQQMQQALQNVAARQQTPQLPQQPLQQPKMIDVPRNIPQEQEEAPSDAVAHSMAKELALMSVTARKMALKALFENDRLMHDKVLTILNSMVVPDSAGDVMPEVSDEAIPADEEDVFMEIEQPSTPEEPEATDADMFVDDMPADAQVELSLSTDDKPTQTPVEEDVEPKETVLEEATERERHVPYLQVNAEPDANTLLDKDDRAKHEENLDKLETEFEKKAYLQGVGDAKFFDNELNEGREASITGMETPTEKMILGMIEEAVVSGKITEENAEELFRELSSNEAKANEEPEKKECQPQQPNQLVER